MTENRKQKINDFINEFTKFSIDCSADTFPGLTLPSTLNQEEIIYLNKILEIHKICGYPKKDLIHELLQNPKNDNLTFYLLRYPQLDYEVNSYDRLNSTVFMKLAMKFFFTYEIFFQSHICNLFIKGYNIKQEDIKYVNGLYNTNANLQEFEKWAFLRFAVKLNDGQKLDKAYLNMNKMLTLLSIKTNKHLIFNYPDLLKVAINGLSNYQDCGEIILETIDKSKYKDLIYNLDIKNKTFQKKKDAFLKNKPHQDTDLKEIAKLILA